VTTTGRPTLAVTPITPAIGAEVAGADLANIGAGTWREIETALAEHAVLVFRAQHALTPEGLVALGSRFGTLHRHPAAPHFDGHPELMVLHADENSTAVSGEGWHTDVSCDEQPPAVTALWIQVTPPTGGDTMFASTRLAYDTLSEPIRDFLSGLHAHHESAHIYTSRYGATAEDSRDGAFPSAVHPVIRTHPVTGRKSLYVNRTFTTGILGLHRDESDALLRLLFGHQEDPRFQCRVRWEPDTVAVWDNRVTLHQAVWDYYPAVRHGLRVSVVGERPY
jgi:taurine dioxygenase